MTFTSRLLYIVVISLVGLFLAGHYTYSQAEVVTRPVAGVATHEWHQLASTTAPPVAASYVVFDMASGEVLLAHDAYTARPVASITKLLTAAVIWQAGLEEDQVSTSVLAQDLVLPGVQGAVAVGESYTPYELLFPLLLTSSNHVASALERTHPTLIKEMNEITVTLALPASAFADASGLSDGNLASADDLRLLTQHVYQHTPHVLDITRLPNYLGGERGWANNSPFIGDPSYRGGKHGYTPAAGRTAVALFAEPFSAGQRVLGYIVLGTADSKAAVTTLRTHVAQTMDWQ